jgi:hypothetical protein
MSAICSMFTEPLFRPEVMQAPAGQWLGGVRVNTSLPWRAMTAGVRGTHCPQEANYCVSVTIEESCKYRAIEK